MTDELGYGGDSAIQRDLGGKWNESVPRLKMGNLYYDISSQCALSYHGALVSSLTFKTIM